MNKAMYCACSQIILHLHKIPQSNLKYEQFNKERKKENKKMF